MPLTTQKLSDVRRSLQIPFDGETLNITYRLSAINDDLWDWSEKHREDREWLMGWIERTVVRWDILDNGEPIAINVATMQRYKVPTPLLNMIVGAIGEDSDSKNLRKAFSDTSSGSAFNQNGTH